MRVQDAVAYVLVQVAYQAGPSAKPVYALEGSSASSFAVIEGFSI